MAQSSYSRSFGANFPGVLADDVGMARVESRTNAQGADIPAGVGLVLAGGVAVSPSAVTDILSGVAVNSFARDPNSLTGANAIKNGATFNLLTEGAIYVATEGSPTEDDPVYCRFASGNGGSVLGAFRTDADGVAEVHTVTPTAANGKTYILRVEIAGKTWTFEYLSSGSATASEIVTALKNLMAADAEFSGLVGASGSTTLILTAVTAGLPFNVHGEGDGVLVSVTTTPAAATAKLIKGARWIKSNDDTAHTCALYFSAATERAANL